MKSVKAFAPGNVSCVFLIKKTTKPETSGSLGMGFTVNKGVTATVQRSSTTTIYFNRKKITFPAVAYITKRLGPATIHLQSNLPLGSGFGISGASALATAYALNTLYSLRKTKLALGKLAHAADAAHLTGLGDVVNQYFGGFLIKFQSSARFKVTRVHLRNKKIHYKCFSKVDTQKILKSRKKKINAAGRNALATLKKLKRKTLEHLITVSEIFTMESGLASKQVKQEIAAIEQNGGKASMIMLGNAVFSNKPFKGSTPLTISYKGAHTL